MTITVKCAARGNAWCTELDSLGARAVVVDCTDGECRYADVLSVTIDPVTGWSRIRLVPAVCEGASFEQPQLRRDRMINTSGAWRSVHLPGAA